jgi:hypothetical protein
MNERVVLAGAGITRHVGVPAGSPIVSGKQAFETVVIFSAKGCSLRRQHFAKYDACFETMARVIAASWTCRPLVVCSIGSLGWAFDGII